jgi:hypothetical protein
MWGFHHSQRKLARFMYTGERDEMRVLVNYLERGAAIPLGANDVTTFCLHRIARFEDLETVLGGAAFSHSIISNEKATLTCTSK